MSQKETNSKLDLKLETKEILKTRNKFKLKFTDFAINNYQSSYHKLDKDGNIIGIRNHTITPFDVTKNSYLKGIKLRQARKSNNKFFVLQFWYQSKADYITIGQFVPDKFGVRQCEDKVFEIYKAHTNDKGLWIKDPRSTIQQEESKIKEDNIRDQETLTINQVIERLCKANFPSARSDRRLSATSIRDHIKFLIGYNWRSQHLVYSEDHTGSGVIAFTHHEKKRTKRPEDWDDLFKKFPAGHGIIKAPHYLNKNDERSVYDSAIGQTKIDELTTRKLKIFFNSTEKSWGQQDKLKEAFRTLWAFANTRDLFSKDIPDNPVNKLRLIKPTLKQSPGTRYNNQRFTDDELKTIYTTLINLADKYPFQSEALLFMLVTGRRAEETLKIRRSHITKDKTRIILPAGITKARKEEIIYITDPISVVLDMLDKKLETTYQKYRFVDWLFPTTRINSKKLHSDKYVRSDQCRTRELRGCWKALKDLTNINGAPKMLRKTYSSIAKLTLGTSSKAIQLTGHNQESTLETYYDKHTPEQVREYAEQVSKVLKFK